MGKNNLHYAFDERTNYYGKRLFKPTTNPRWVSCYSTLERIFHKILYKVRKPHGEDMSSIIQSLDNQNELRLFQKDMVRSDLWYKKKSFYEWKIIWENGILKDATSGLEFLHFHFIDSKRKKEFHITPYNGKKFFVITSKGIGN